MSREEPLKLSRANRPTAVLTVDGGVQAGPRRLEVSAGTGWMMSFQRGCVLSVHAFSQDICLTLDTAAHSRRRREEEEIQSRVGGH